MEGFVVAEGRGRRMRIWRAGPGVQAYYMTQYVVSEITFRIQWTPHKLTEAFFVVRESL